ncbi:MAG TPA: JAB domain-containing protein [Verrucomicrobiae bacterium]|nr:JAB domain-containing protein [Verrucomicrobiae bacterium]
MNYKLNTDLTADIVSRLGRYAVAKQEHMLCFTLDSASRVITKHRVFKGTLSSCPANPLEIFRAAIEDSASRIVIAHNHPYGEPAPSPNDIEVTQRLIACGRILGIPLIDHIVVAGNKHFSFSENRLMDIYEGERIQEYLN